MAMKGYSTFPKAPLSRFFFCCPFKRWSWPIFMFFWICYVTPCFLRVSSVFCSVSLSSSSFSSCSSSGIYTSSVSNLALNLSAWDNFARSFFFSCTAVFCPFCRINFALSGSDTIFHLYQTFSSVANDMVIVGLICLQLMLMGFAFYPHEEPFDNLRVN